MNFNNLNKIFENKFTISKNLLKEEASLKYKKEKSKKKLTESIDRNLTERDWKLTIPGSFRDDMLNAGEEEDFDKVKNILIDMCNYVLEHIDESNFDLDDQEYVIEEFEYFIEELEYVDFEDEDEANYYLNDLYDLLDNTDIFLGLREGLNERLVDGEYVPDNSVVVDLDGISYILIKNTDGDNLYHFKELGCDDYNILKLSKKEVKDELLKNGYSNDFIRAEILREGLLDESLNEEKITGGDMEQEDINIIQPLIDDFDSLEDANKDVLSITWNFGRRNSDNKMTAGVDIYFLVKGSEENLQPYLKQVEDIILSDGYKFDDSLGYDEDHWKEHAFGDGYHTQIIEIEDANECLTESEFRVGRKFNRDNIMGAVKNPPIKSYDEIDKIFHNSKFTEYLKKIVDKAYGGDITSLTKEEAYSIYQDWKLSESLNEEYEEVDLSDYEYVGNVDGFSTYRKIITDENSETRGVWAAQDQNEKEPPFRITYDQALGHEPIKDTHGIKKLSRDLGRILLPQDESLNESEQDLESGYYPDEWDIDFEDELENLGIEPQRGVYIGYQYRVPNRRFASKMVRLAKEFGYDDSWVEGNILYLKWSRPEKEYHKTPYDESLNESNEEKPSKEQFIAYCIIQHSGITNMFNVDKVIEASDYVLDIPLTKENILYIYSHYSELLDEYHGFNPDMFESEIYDVRDSYGMSTDDYDESLNESWALFFDGDGINHAGSDGAHKFNLSPERIERKIKSSDYHLPDWAKSYIILSDSQFDKMDYDEIEKYHKRYGKTLNEDTVKQNGKWVNKGKEGTHGKFKTKKEADAQRKAMFANGFMEDLKEEYDKGSKYAEAVQKFIDGYGFENFYVYERSDDWLAIDVEGADEDEIYALMGRLKSIFDSVDYWEHYIEIYIGDSKFLD